jgi:hypothetical protein
MKGIVIVALQLYGNSQKELDFKKKMLKSLFQTNKKIVYKDQLIPEMRNALFSTPELINIQSPNADAVHFYCPLEKVFDILEGGSKLIHSHSLKFGFDFLIADHGHRVLGTITYCFPPEEVNPGAFDPVFKHDLQALIIKNEGIPSGDDSAPFKDILHNMDPVTNRLIQKIQKLLDPHRVLDAGIFN